MSTTITSPAPSSATPTVPRSTRIVPSRGWPWPRFGELWAWRELFWFLLWRDVSVRYKQTVLGAAWAVLQPACTMIVFSVVFGRLAGLPSDGVPYPVFSFAGLLPWLFFQNGVVAAGNSLVANRPLITKVYVPRLLVPASAVGVAGVDLAIASVLLAVLCGVYGVLPGVGLCAVPAVLLLLTLLTVAAGTLVAALNVAYRDFRYAVPFLVQLLLFCTPVAFPASLVPERWRLVLYLNPVAGVVGGFRAAVLNTPVPWTGLAMSLATSLLLCGLAAIVFQRLERQFADVI